ncbi:MAG TPA: 50S ribosomal protein L15 [Candidatus Paceibacterota bacterium]|jgi:large subunit ribosomal protein L15|nr:50S ribosomal protein L15 [Parcubacteria group bacterium]MDP6119419.1 50S ribosomal protein L15 [Candidatus Paceibacterota bacterium]HJN63058.1 50S ribosomal protein L15 [Candidatus Paceibacterota bacterium]|tara:strand:- start:653 stop:1084 length:432 start_codon:yes stop_codon:yes gene_type:complete
MQIHNLKRKTPNTRKVKVGRGGKRGKTSGRGHKGQKSRAGRKIRPEIRDMIKKIPKKRGYRFKSFQIRPQVINVSALDMLFENGDNVNVRSLLAREVVNKKKGKNPKVKILGNGEIKKKLNLEGLLVSEIAKGKIEKVGGTIK